MAKKKKKVDVITWAESTQAWLKEQDARLKEIRETAKSARKSAEHCLTIAVMNDAQAKYILQETNRHIKNLNKVRKSSNLKPVKLRK